MQMCFAAVVQLPMGHRHCLKTHSGHSDYPQSALASCRHKYSLIHTYTNNSTCFRTASSCLLRELSHLCQYQDDSPQHTRMIGKGITEGISVLRCIMLISAQVEQPTQPTSMPLKCKRFQHKYPNLPSTLLGRMKPDNGQG